MIYYTTPIISFLAILGIIVLLSIYFQFVGKQPRVAFLLLLSGGFLLRLLMASMDPFLHDWDERFHALVAKNLMSHPLRPMLRVNPLLPFKMEDWCCSHIWVHKQPLFLWQMALSMKIFGTNVFALRLPSVLMGTLSIYFIYSIAKNWTKNIDIAFVAALLFSVSYYQLELTAGQHALDHNDLAFTFYVTASIWAFVKYLSASNKYLWAILVGIFVGGAVLNKWLTGLLIFGGWGLYLLLHLKTNFDTKKWLQLVLSILVSITVFLPWQLYILYNYPIETQIMYEHNRRHIFEVLENHHGSVWFHFIKTRFLYGQFLRLFFPIGLFFVFRNKETNRKLTISLFAMVVVIYGFFSIVVQTKMPAFTFPVSALVWTTIAIGIIMGFKFLFKKQYTTLLTPFLLVVAIYAFKPWRIVKYRSASNSERKVEIENTKIYKSLDLSGNLKGRVVLNCNSFEDVELMFYKDVNAYAWYPDERTLDSLIQIGYKFAAFKSHKGQQLPEYLYRKDKDILIIDKALQ